MRKYVLIFLLFFANLIAYQNSFAYSSSVPRSLPFVHNGNIYTDTLSYSNEAGTWNLYVTDGSMVKCQKANYDWTEYWGYTGAVTYIECYTTGTGGSFTLSYETFDTSGNLVDSYWDYTQSNGSVMMFMATNLVHYPFSSDQLAFSRDIYNVAGDTVVFGANAGLKWPLSGTFASRTIGWTFGATWTYGQCPSGTYKKHAGIDVNATASEAVYSAHGGVVKEIHDSTGDGWAYAIVIEDNSGQFTTVYWHVNAYGNLAVDNTVTKGQQIATIANISPNTTHFHFGIRMGAYSDPESYAGALPVANGCEYLAYPENFIDPESMTYQ